MTHTASNLHSPSRPALARVAPRVVPEAHTRPRWRYSANKQQWKLGGAFYMAQEIAAQLPTGARLLDVGCGSGFIAHHLSGLLGQQAAGVDVRETTDAPIDYSTFDGVNLPHPDQSFDALLSAHVLHHAADCRALIADMARVLKGGGTLVVYEDVPGTVFDRLLCWRHDRAWRSRSGPCTFHMPQQWISIFEAAGFFLRLSTPLSRLRDLSHPVARQFLVLERER